MKTVMNAKDMIAKVWSPPKLVEGQNFRLMKYILRSSCEDGILLYNVVTSEMLLLEEPVDLDGDLKNLPEEMLKELIQRHFVVPEDFDEKKSVDQLRSVLRTINRPRYITGYTIYPTTCCNAKCFYCFESDFHKETMTEDTADALVKYIQTHSGGKAIDISWFGGEPLVGKNIISYICQELKNRNISFCSAMITNAYLFDESVVQTAVEQWKLKKVQITLDGTEEVYNRTKDYQNVSGSPYQRVLSNIELLLNAGISITIRLNISASNTENLLLLADELKARFDGKRNLQVYAHLIYDNVGYHPVSYTEETKDTLYDRFLIVQNKLLKEKLSFGYHKLPYLKEINCMADNDACVTVFPDGRVGKCENSSANDAICNIYGDKFPEKVLLCKEYTEYSICNNCPLYPYCLHLAVCPEEGECSVNKSHDKIRNYTRLLKEKYRSCKKKQNEDIITFMQCDSED